MRRLFVPLALLIVAIAVDQGHLEVLPASWYSLNACRLDFALVFALAWRFRRGRLAFTVLAFAAATEAAVMLDRLTPTLDLVMGQTAVVLVAGWLGCGLGLVPWLKEWRVATRAGFVRLAVLALGAVAVAWTVTSANPQVATLRQWIVHQGPLRDDWPLLPLPHFLILAFALGGFSLIVRFVRHRQALEAGLLAVWIATVAAAWRAWQGLADGSGVAPPSRIFLWVIGLILGASLIEGAFSLAFEDGLTGLPARRALEESLLQLGPQYTLAMVDIDHFKKLNDRHGHEIGDQVLRMVAQTLRDVGGGGEVFRYGGEEFTVLFRGKGSDACQPHLETLRKAIATRRFEVRSPARPKGNAAAKGRGSGGQGKSLRVTVSLGAAQRDERLNRPALVMKAADKALYRAKRSGRNRLTMAN